MDITDKAVLVVADPSDYRETEANTEELRLLAESADVRIVDEMHVRRPYPDPRYFIGSGNAEEVFLRVQESDANVVLLGADLSPTQQRNLEKIATVRVVDRTQLILDIFAQRARTSEGKLQVELAQLEYLLPRLTGKGTEMSRIGGGSAGGVATRGPGETKLETDRKRIRKRISVLKDELEDVVKHRSVQNKARRELLVPNVALVGYTSAGKSTLLNLLAHSEVEAHERLFATLDPTTRRVELDDGTSIILSDTVGFIRNLPHNLVAAFRATLEEVIDADILIHVVDSAHYFSDEQRKAVEEVLEELDAADKPIITVFNKCDLVRDQYEIRRMVAETAYSCYMSALTGEGLKYLQSLIRKVASQMMRRIDAVLPYNRGDLAALCHDRGRVIESEYIPEGIHIIADIPPDLAAKLQSYVIDSSEE